MDTKGYYNKDRSVITPSQRGSSDIKTSLSYDNLQLINQQKNITTGHSINYIEDYSIGSYIQPLCANQFYTPSYENTQVEKQWSYTDNYWTTPEFKIELAAKKAQAFEFYIPSFDTHLRSIRSWKDGTFNSIPLTYDIVDENGHSIFLTLNNIIQYYIYTNHCIVVFYNEKETTISLKVHIKTSLYTNYKTAEGHINYYIFPVNRNFSTQSKDQNIYSYIINADGIITDIAPIDISCSFIENTNYRIQNAIENVTNTYDFVQNPLKPFNPNFHLNNIFKINQ